MELHHVMWDAFLGVVLLGKIRILFVVLTFLLVVGMLQRQAGLDLARFKHIMLIVSLVS